MAPKVKESGGKQGSKSKGKGKDDGESGGGSKLKAATSINTRHILVRL